MIPAVFRDTVFLSISNISAALAQLVEHLIRNERVACSSHVGGLKFSDIPVPLVRFQRTWKVRCPVGGLL